MSQLLLIPDPRPLVERLGADFFKEATEAPGVYLMRDAADEVLYVGKAKSLRKRLGSYRVANPDRMPRRHLRMLRAVARIELRECTSESEALATEAALLRELKPKFNRAGTWSGPRRHLGWRLTETGLELAITTEPQEGWLTAPPMGSGAFYLRAILARQLWCAIHSGTGFDGMPEGWFRATRADVMNIPPRKTPMEVLQEAHDRLRLLFADEAEGFIAWIRERCVAQTHPFHAALREEDLEELAKMYGDATQEPNLPTIEQTIPSQG